MFRRKTVFTSLSTLVLFILCSGITVYAHTNTDVSGDLDLGVVNIDVSIENGELENIFPGQTILYEPVITNLGYESYIRASYQISSFAEYLTPSDFSEEWVQKSDGYYYYTKSVTPDEQIIFFHSVQISPWLPEESRSEEILLSVRAEAIQAENFTPDFQNDTPWGDIEIESYEKSDVYTISGTEGQSADLSIVYEADADQLIVNSDDFFYNMPVLMPGDTYTQSAALQNTYDSPIDLYFYSLSDLSDPLLKEASLTVESSDRGIVYDGPLNGETINGSGNAVLLSTTGTARDEQMSFTISVPEKLKNEYTLWNSRINWVFTTDVQKPEPTPEEPGRSAPPVRTGDSSTPAAYLIPAGIALFILIFLLFFRKRDPVKGDSHDRYS